MQWGRFTKENMLCTASALAPELSKRGKGLLCKKHSIICKKKKNCIFDFTRLDYRNDRQKSAELLISEIPHRSKATCSAQYIAFCKSTSKMYLFILLEKSKK